MRLKTRPTGHQAKALLSRRPEHARNRDLEDPCPRTLAHLTQEEWAEKVRTLVQAKEVEARERRLEKGKKVLGLVRILAQDPFSCPKSQAPHFKLNPRLAAKSKWARIEALRRNRSLLEKYRDAIKSTWRESPVCSSH